MNRSSSVDEAPLQALPPRESPAAYEIPVWRRWVIKLFVATLLLVIVVQCAPRRFAAIDFAKDAIGPVARRLGLWQAEWALFAPDPQLNNAWLSAEIYAPDGTLTTWNSTYWGTASGVQKFRDFRMLNFGNRLSRRDPLARDDFADYIARQMIGPGVQAVVVADGAIVPVQNAASENLSNQTDSKPGDRWRLVLFRSQLLMTLPADGALPSRDETLWISSSQQLVEREYQP